MITYFFSLLQSNYTNVTRMTIFNYLKTGNPVYDAIFSTIMLTIGGYILNYIYDNQLDKSIYKFCIDDIKYILYKKNTIVLEGRRSSVVSNYSLAQNISSAYSDRFKAFWDYIIGKIEKNNTIYRIKESHSNYQSSDGDDRKKSVDIFMVYQNKHFILDENIYVKAELEQDETRDDKDKVNTKTDKFIINIYSYVYSLSYLKNYIDNITEKYLASIKENRINKRFIYSLEKVSSNKDSDESILDCWREDIFESTRAFKNIFFDGKNELLSKIDFFLNNREWYFKKGIPYSLGIGLHGPPGTGKTSFIKALANYTNRHIITMSLKTIKTKKQLEQFFFENTYNDNNEKYSISFEKKIIVFEDIDCVGDIILDRNNKNNFSKNNNNNSNNNNNFNKNNSNNSINNLGNVIQSICDMKDTSCPVVIGANHNDEQPYTLDDFLNLWDGIRETPGRILIISSNHYNKLDSALIRPGRIDITHELRNASHNTISEIYTHLFETDIDAKLLKKVKEYFYSPAELINMYVSTKNEKDFMTRLLQNKKV